jgi:hypothetical protein
MKNLFFVFFAAVAVTFAACSKEEQTIPEPPAPVYEVDMQAITLMGFYFENGHIIFDLTNYENSEDFTTNDFQSDVELFQIRINTEPVEYQDGDKIMIPAGEYRFNSENPEAVGSMDQLTCYKSLPLGAEEIATTYFDGGKVTVTEDGIVGEFTAEGKLYRVKFEGEHTLGTYKAKEPEETTVVDMEATIIIGEAFPTGHFIVDLTNYEDYIYNLSSPNMDLLRIYILSEPIDYKDGDKIIIPTGEYPFSKETPTPSGTVLPHSYFVSFPENTEEGAYVAFDGGKVTVTEDGIVAELTAEGKLYRVEYNGEPTLGTYKAEEPEEPSEPQMLATTVTLSPTFNPATGQEDPYQIWFNIKSNGDEIVSGRYMIVNERYYNPYINSGLSLNIFSNSIEFTPDEIAQINSSEGLNVSREALPDTQYCLFVDARTAENQAVKDEFGILPEEHWTMNKTIRKLDKTRVESPYFETLQGEWTATVTKASINMDAPVEQTFTSKIVIGPSALPEQLDGELKSRMMSAAPYIDASMADAFYSSMLMNQSIFNEDVRGQNQLLCVGFDFTNGTQGVDVFSKSIEDYFIQTLTDGSYNSNIFQSWGTKWYIEFDENGNAYVPISVYKDYPANYMGDTSYYATALAQTQYGITYLHPSATIKFPVEISEDGNTITIKGLAINNTEVYYLNVVPMTFNSFAQEATITFAPFTVLSDIVLTRNQ